MIDHAYAGLEANSLQPVGKYLKMKRWAIDTSVPSFHPAMDIMY